MFNPKIREKNLTQVDTKAQTKTRTFTAVLAVGIVAAVFTAAEIVFRVVSAFLGK